MPATKKRILIAADKDCISNSSKEWLESQGFYCCRAESTKKVLNHLREMPFDIMVLDNDLANNELEDFVDTCFNLRQRMGLLLLADSQQSKFEHIQIPIAISYLEPPYEHTRLIAGIQEVLEHCLAVDEYTQLEQSFNEFKNRFFTLMNTIPDAVFDLDYDGNITHANHQAEVLFGFTLHELMKTSFQQLLLESGQLQFSQYLNMLHTPSTRHALESHLSLMANDRSGQSFPVDIRLAPLDSDEHQQLVCIVRDTTSMQRASSELRDYQKKLEHRIEQRSRELSASKRELQGLYDSMTYELNIPLRKISGFCEILLEDCAASMNSTVTDYVFRIRTSSQNMGDMIEDYVKQSRQLQGNLRRGQIDLSNLADEVMQHIIETHPEQQINFTIENECQAHGDMQLLRIMLEHLLDNACKFSSHNSQTCITFGSTLQSGCNVFYIKDEGVGFDLQLAEKLFRPFSRLHLDSEFQGTGMGLASVQRIIDRHGGRIWVDSSPNNGACFYFTLDKYLVPEKVAAESTIKELKAKKQN